MNQSAQIWPEGTTNRNLEPLLTRILVSFALDLAQTSTTAESPTDKSMALISVDISGADRRNVTIVSDCFVAEQLAIIKKETAKMHLTRIGRRIEVVADFLIFSSIADLTCFVGIVVIDRGFIDYKLFARWTDQGIYFVTRLKENADFGAYQRRTVPENTLIRADELGMLNILTAGAWWRRQMRVITVWDERHQRKIKLLTSHLGLAASTIAAIYKDRWQIEIFFKTLKQNLKIKTFVGSSANAVRTQIWTALIAMLLIKILQLRSTFAWALSNLIALLRWNLFSYRDLWSWINRPFDTPPESPPEQPELFDLDSIPQPG
jgi:Transposase DDE domain